uniref:TSA: Wollemia nobilis Ref_Wollemi_Transcript_13793_1594 transcribed RNA sequence n=1 Tax=Wollemia nobilis TaxID=56998 RepID=A0A0C9RTM1_9CONI
MGGHTVDGCGEFMPADEDGLKCAACGCHRNFHRREVEGEETPLPCECCARRDRKRGAGEPPVVAYYTTPPLPHGTSAAAAAALLHVPMGIPESDDLDGNNFNNNNYEHSQGRGLKKRFRTKFSQDQKDKMCYFADKIGWKMKKEDEESVLEFCNQVGVGKGVLKVWMHNNKHTLGKKPS